MEIIKKYTKASPAPKLIEDGQQIDTQVISNKMSMGHCLLCGNDVQFQIHHENLRETVACPICLSYNRQRQLIAALSIELTGKIHNLRYLLENVIKPNSKILILESVTNLASALKAYAPSTVEIHDTEYISDEFKSGDLSQNGIVHLDIHDAHYPDNHFDIIIHADVFEHVADAPQAEKEQVRILKKGGIIAYTAPFTAGAEEDDVRAVIDKKGKLKLLKEKVYHGDPAPREDHKDKNGCLVFRTFSYPELYGRHNDLKAQFTCYGLYAYQYGIFGNNGFAFTVKKK